MLKKFSDYTWTEIDSMDKSKTIVMLPVGSFEQHGQHLPLSTDSLHATYLSEGIAAKLGEDFPLLVLPTIPFGQSVEHLDFTGTISLNPETLYHVILDIADSIAGHGFLKFVIINGHGGNSGIINAISYQIKNLFGIDVFILDISVMLGDDKAPVQVETENGNDFHGGELETSLVLASNPELVHMERAKNIVPERYVDNKYLRLSGPVFMGWCAKDVSSIGIAGDSRKATKEKGEKLYEYMIQNACEAMKEIHAW